MVEVVKPSLEESLPTPESRERYRQVMDELAKGGKKLLCLVPETVGELRRLLESLPDDMPLHRSGNGGHFPKGVMLTRRKLSAADNEPDYFADLDHDPVWSKPHMREGFGEPVDTLCIG